MRCRGRRIGEAIGPTALKLGRVSLYFEVLDKKNIGLNLRLDYTNPRGDGSQVSSTACEGITFKSSVKEPNLEDLEFEEEEGYWKKRFEVEF